MKISTQVTLSLIIIITLTTFSMIIISSRTVDVFTELNMKGIQRAVSNVSKANYQMSEKLLTAYGERLVSEKANSISKELSYFFKSIKQPYDYKELRKNKDLRKIGTQDIYSWNKDVGYVDIVDRNGIAVIHPNPEIEGKNYSEYKSEYPEMWRLLERSFKDNDVKGTYFFLGKANKPVRKYMVIKHIPGTNLNLCAVVNIDDFFIPVHEEIAKTEAAASARAEAFIHRASEKIQKDSKTTIMFAGIAVLFFGIIYGIWFGRFIARPIAKLREALTELERGNFDIELEEEGCSETIMVTTAFNRLSKQFSEQQTKILKPSPKPTNQSDLPDDLSK
jgi:nitrogen fixation/metabolism regulation signal transduction histidine kinase